MDDQKLNELEGMLLAHNVGIRKETFYKNGEEVEGIIVKSEDNPVAPVLYTNNTIFKSDVTEIRDYILDILKTTMPEIGSPEQYIKADYILKSVRPRLIPYTKKPGYEKGGYVVEEFLPWIYKTYYVNIPSACHYLASYCLKYDHIDVASEMNHYGFLEEVEKAALKNAEAYLKATTLESLLGGYLAPTAVSGLDKKVIVLTNIDCTYGASAMMCTKALDAICDACGEAIYILPSSIHEVIAVPESMGSRDDLINIVCEVNTNVLNVEDWLSDNVYLYDHGYKVIR